MKRCVAAVCVLSTLLVTMPVSAAELAAPRTSLGSVSGVGPVSVRGITIPQEATVFSGDELQTGSKAFAKVMLVAGHRLQLDADTRINIQQDNKVVTVQVRSG